MCINGSVGERGINGRADAVVVQVLLNLSRPAPRHPPEVDGSAGPATIQAIRDFQAGVMGMVNPDGRVDPGGRTLSALRASLPHYAPTEPLSEMRLKGVMPLGSWAKIRLYLPHLQEGMRKRDISTALRQAHFLVQLGHESMSFVYAEEIASGTAYEGRLDLGNTQPGDGVRFKGRGLIQLTGRTNYTNYGKAIGRNLTDGSNPSLVATDASLAVDAACWFWSTRKLNLLADSDNVTAITRAVNGGLNGFDDRKAYLRRAKFFFGL